MRSNYLIIIIIFVYTFTSFGMQPADTKNDPWTEVPEILEKIIPPAFPDKEYNVLDFNVKPGLNHDSREAIQSVIDKCNAEGGGKIIIPKGEYLLNGPLHLKSDINLHLMEGAVIYFGSDPDDYLPAVLVRWEGTRCYNYSPFIYAFDKKNIAITGKGTIDGQQQNSWMLWKLIQDQDKIRLRKMGKQLAPVGERVFGKGHYLRPSLIEFYKCENILIEGVTVKNSPFWTIHPVLCNNVTITNVDVQPGQSNDDGCDPESSSYVLIENCSFYTEDDNIAIKAGRDNDAWIENGGRPSENIIIRNNSFHSVNAACITIGSEMSGGVRNIFAENNKIVNAGTAFYIKSNTDRGGIVENLYFRKNNVDTCDIVFQAILNYKGADTGEYPSIFRNFIFEDVNIKYALMAVQLVGLPQTPIKYIYLNNIIVDEVQLPAEVYYTDDLIMTNNKFNVIRADEKEYFTKSSGGEEDPDRLFWNDLPADVQESFIKVFNNKIDKSSNIPAKYRDEVKKVFAVSPVINNISVKTVRGEKVFRLKKSFGWDEIDVILKKSGEMTGNQ